ncbi:MAG: glucosamine-6-phosphate deaminase [Bacteroidota bacterium]
MVPRAGTFDASSIAPRRRIVNDGLQRERIPVLIFDQPGQIARQVALRISNLVQERRRVGKMVVLGLPTGSTPIGVYRELIRRHQEEGLDLSNVVTFNLDEYYPMDPKAVQSYHRFMRETFFDHVNIPDAQIHIPRGDLGPEDVEAHAVTYEHSIEKAGGIDLMLLGIGRSGHIGFNEPGAGPETRTRLVTLDEITRKDASSAFFGLENVPRQAITMGVASILDAREIILIATGEHKAAIVRRAVEEPPTRSVTASFLQRHPNASFYVDAAAAQELTRVVTPWLVQELDWNAESTREAVIWLSEKVGNAILRLEGADFYEHHLHGLVYAHDTVDALCRHVFEGLRRRILYPDDLFKRKKVIVFSPHPDDDVISMGGMLDKLVKNRNEVAVAYMTNGSVAVFDDDARRYLQFVEMSGGALGLDTDAAAKQRAHIQQLLAFLDEKGPGATDLEDIQHLKAYIRYSEAIAGIKVMGLDPDAARFLNLPFYQTGKVKKAPITQADVDLVLQLLEEVQPDHVYVAGDLSDPHGTHRMCYDAIRLALDQYNERHETVEAYDQIGRPLRKKRDAGGVVKPLVWLYRGAWQEWEISRADVFLPLSKADIERKTEAIFKHESQKDRAMFPGAHDTREFWQRAQERNRGTAEALNRLGLPEFYAAEAFVTTYAMP